MKQTMLPLNSLLGIVAALGLASHAMADPTPYNHSDARLRFDPDRSDDFTTASSIDSSKWTIKGPVSVGLGADDPANVALIGGVLEITGQVVSTPVKGCYYTGGSIESVFRYGYGYYEICAMMPDVPGWTSSLRSNKGASNRMIMVSFNSAYTSSVDLNCGYESAYNGIHGYPKSRYRYGKFILDTESVDTGSTSLKTAYHYYGLEWTPTELIWYLDGEKIKSVEYFGPHSPIGLKLALAARTVLNSSPSDGAKLRVKHIRYWKKDYDMMRRDASIVAAPTAIGLAYPESEIAFNHQVFDWDAANLTYTTRPGRSGWTIPLSSGDPANPIQQFYVGGDLARWDYPGTADAADVFAWNPALFPTSYLQADYGPHPASNEALFTIVGDGSSPSGTAVIDQIHDGQKWVWLGLHSFDPGNGYVKLSPQNWTAQLGLRAGAMQFRQLDGFYDDFSGGFSGWSVSSGNWSVSSGVLSQGSASPSGVALLLRTSSPSWADHFVRGQVKFDGASSAINVALVGRYQANGDHYLLRLTPAASVGGSATLDLLRKSGSAFATLASAALESDVDPTVSFVDLHLLMVGNRLQALANGELALDVIDSSPILSAGQAGLRTYGGTASFDQLGVGQ